jgi:hypothetical protein
MASIDGDTTAVVAYMIYYFMREYLFNDVREDRVAAFFDDRLDWNRIVQRHGSRAAFKRHLRMSQSSFNKLLSYIPHDLKVNQVQGTQQGGAIIPVIHLYCTLR